MLSVGELIWVSCRPLLRLILCATCGVVITKADIFPPVAARGAGQILLNITLPCLMFSKIVPAFTADNINALGPLVVVAFVYEALGVLFAWLVTQFFWVPHRFRYGILVAGGWGNVSDIPTAVIMSITASAPFNGVNDQNLAVAYISAFILVFMISLFPLGAHRWISMDYTGPEVENEEVQEAIRRKRHSILFGWPRLLLSSIHKRYPREKTSDEEVSCDEYEKDKPSTSINTASPDQRPSIHRKHVSFHENATTQATNLSPPLAENEMPSRSTSTDRTTTGIDTLWSTSQTANELSSTLSKSPTSIARPTSPGSHAINNHLQPQLKAKIITFLKSFLNMPTIAILVAFPIALISPLKALFVPVPGTHISPAPDGQPPLAFLMDTATFIGGASVPIGLICLGSALARLKVPSGRWTSLPLGAIASFAVSKILIMPILGVLICENVFVRVGLIPRDNKVLRFVCIFFSCLPTATTQVFLTQVYSGTGSAEHLSAFLIPQYILMFISMTALTAYTIHLLF